MQILKTTLYYYFIMNFVKYAAGMFVFAGIISLLAGSGGNYFTQSVNAQSLGEQIGETIGGALDETGEGLGNATEVIGGAVNETGEAAGNATEVVGGAANETGEAAGNATEGASQAANETGEAAGNATEGASQAASNTASEAGQAADNATTSGNGTNATDSKNPLDMLMNLFKGN